MSAQEWVAVARFFMVMEGPPAVVTSALTELEDRLGWGVVKLDDAELPTPEQKIATYASRLRISR